MRSAAERTIDRNARELNRHMRRFFPMDSATLIGFMRRIINIDASLRTAFTTCSALLITILVSSPSKAQKEPRPPLPREIAEIAGTMSAMAGQKSLPPENVANMRSWIEPADSFRVVGPIYFVGTRGLGVYLITTPQGHILLDGGMPSSCKDIEASIRKLGFRPEDIRLLLITQAHIDHVGTLAYFKKLSGASVVVMDRDFEHLKTGGKTDSIYGMKPAFYFPPVTAERVLKDGDVVALGKVALTARLTAGHTQGCTTWVTTVVDGGKSYRVVFPGSSGVNPGYRLVGNPSYPGIADDYLRTFGTLKSLQPDIWLAAHTQAFGFERKRARAVTEGVRAWVDPEGYRRYVAASKAAFDALVAREKK
jgi:metallo-beta-lactamase class B